MDCIIGLFAKIGISTRQRFDVIAEKEAHHYQHHSNVHDKKHKIPYDVI